MKQTVSDAEPDQHLLTDGPAKIVIQDMNFYYGTVQALKGVNMTVPANKVTAFIGPSGCGKSTLLRCLNRLNDLVDGTRVEGTILLDGENIYHPEVDATDLRTRVGMVFQKINPFPKSIWAVTLTAGPMHYGAAPGYKSERLGVTVRMPTFNA